MPEAWDPVARLIEAGYPALYDAPSDAYDIVTRDGARRVASVLLNDEPAWGAVLELLGPPPTTARGAARASQERSFAACSNPVELMSWSTVEPVGLVPCGSCDACRSSRLPHTASSISDPLGDIAHSRGVMLEVVEDALGVRVTGRLPQTRTREPGDSSVPTAGQVEPGSSRLAPGWREWMERTRVARGEWSQRVESGEEALDTRATPRQDGSTHSASSTERIDPMPVRFLPHSLRTDADRPYRLTCTRCDVSHDVVSSYIFDETADATFRFSRSRGRYAARCRTCTRDAAAANRSARRVRARAAASAAAEARMAAYRAERDARLGAPAPSPRIDTTPAHVLPADRRWGVELELICSTGRSTLERVLVNAGFGDWRVRTDGSLSAGGLEVVSPILRGDAGIDAMTAVCRLLRDNGCTVNSSCGTHIHHEIRDLSLAQAQRFGRTWANNQHLIDGLVAPSRRGRTTYCSSFTHDDAAELDRTSSLAHLRITRYKSLNFTSYGQYGTVEVRQHQGTLDAEKIRTWLKFGQALISTCASNDAPLAPAASVSSLLGSLAARFLDETAHTFLLGRAVQFAHARVA